MVIGLPLFILGCIHHLIPYLSLKKFIEGTFKRRVFWSGIKMILGFFIISLYNIILIFSINAVFDLVNGWVAWSYLILLVPFLGLIAYEYNRLFKTIMAKNRTAKSALTPFLSDRKELEDLIEKKVLV